MDFLKVVVLQQTFFGVVFGILAVAGILGQRRWGRVASAVVVVLSWPAFLGVVLVNELMTAPQLLALNPFWHLFRISLWKPATVATASLLVVFWLARRVATDRRAITWGAIAGVVWAYVMPIPLVLVSLALMTVIPMGTAAYYYVDFRPMGLDVLETAKPNFHHYRGDAIPLRYRAELDGRAIEVWVQPVESLSAHFNVRAIAPDSPLFVVERAPVEACSQVFVREADNVITTYWSAGPDAQKICYASSGEAALTIRFTGSETSLTLHGPVVKAGDYWFYDSL